MEIGGQLQDLPPPPPPPSEVDDSAISTIPNDVAQRQQQQPEGSAYEPPLPPMPSNVEGALPNSFDPPPVEQQFVSEEVSVVKDSKHTYPAR